MSSSRRFQRRSIRLPGYNYAQTGAYFVTICTHGYEYLFGDIVDAGMVLHDAGRIVVDEWLRTAQIRAEIDLDEWVVMPNHFHGIVVIGCAGDRPVAPTTGPKPKSIGALIAGFKSAVTKRINHTRRTPGAQVWQRNYCERVIRNDSELHRIREYIRNNPARWESDQLYERATDHLSGQLGSVCESMAIYGFENYPV